MKITKSQLQQIIAEELEGFDPTSPREQGPPAGVPCYLVYADYKGYDQYVRYASGEKADVINFMRWNKENPRAFGHHRLGVVEIAGDQIEGSAPGRPGGYEKDITDEVLGSL